MVRRGRQLGGWVEAQNILPPRQRDCGDGPGQRFGHGQLGRPAEIRRVDTERRREHLPIAGHEQSSPHLHDLKTTVTQPLGNPRGLSPHPPLDDCFQVLTSCHPTSVTDGSSRELGSIRLQQVARILGVGVTIIGVSVCREGWSAAVR